MKVIILGANSIISKSLIYEIVKLGSNKLVLFTTNQERCKNFLSSINANTFANVVCGYETLLDTKADIIINCIGVGTPKNMNNDYTPWFSVLEYFDNLCISYLKKYPKALYVNFSSGVVYGDTFKHPVKTDTKPNFDVNNLGLNNFYAIAKLYAEAKHRAFKQFNIIDLRMFAFFSKFVNLNDGYFMSDLANAIINGSVLSTNNEDMTRDYINPRDLLELIISCQKLKNINCSVDLISKAPITKYEILKLAEKEWGLKYQVCENLTFLNSSGMKNNYYSENNIYNSLNFSPKYSSAETIIRELDYLVKNKHLLLKN